MQNLANRMNQLDGEHIRSFAWRVDMAHGLTLSYEELGRRVLRGLSRGIIENLPKRKSPWSLDSLLELGDNLDKSLPQSDPYFQSTLKYSMKVVSETRCNLCQRIGHSSTTCSREFPRRVNRAI